MAGQLGWSPRDFWSSTFAELHFMHRGWLKSQGVDTEPPITLEDYQRLKDKFPDEQ
tara:strand:- start:1059 stop:1226 length:168 start_codon:yes stop_codon:yes gene_type:complete